MASKNFPVSEQLHRAVKVRAKQQGRMLQSVVAEAFYRFLGKDFPPGCREAELVPERPNKEK